MVNKIIVIGNLGADPEVSMIQNGKKRAEFSVATSHKFTNKNTGEVKENIDWHRIECWSGLADIVESYVKKGMLVWVEGMQRHVKYEKEGESKTRSYIYAKEIKILTPKNQ